MKAEWMANVGGQEYGPFTWDQMLEMAAEGRVTPDLPVRKANESQWSVAAAVPGLLGGGTPAAKPVAKPAASAGAPKGTVVKKTRPTGPPVGRPVPPVVTAPRSIPAGVPVGAAAPPPVQAPPAPPLFSLDVSSSPGSKKRAAQNSTGKSVLDEEDEVAPRKNNALLIVGILGGAIALVAVVAGLVVFIMMNRWSNEARIVATNASDVPGETAEAGEPGSPAPEGEPGSESKTLPAKPAKTTKGEAKSAEPAAQLAAVKAIHDWKNVAILKSLIIGNAKISVSRVWLAPDASGNRAAPGEEATPAAETAPAGAKSAESRKYLFLQVAIGNKAGSPLKYKGWNIAKTPPFVVDDQDRILKLVPNTQTPGVARLTKSDVPGGGTVEDILVFEAPTEPFEKLRIVLPQNVFYDKTRNPYFGLEVTTDVIGNEGGPPVAPATSFATGDEKPLDPQVVGRKLPADPATPEAPTLAEPTKDAKGTAKKEEPPAKKPSLIDEINKSFEEQEKTKKMYEGKGKEPEKPADTKTKEPAKPQPAKPEPAKPAEPAKAEENPFQPVKPGEPAKKTEPAKKSEPTRKSVPAKKPEPEKTKGKD